MWLPFFLGLGGSLHCAGMCGPLVMMLPHPGGGWSGHLASRLVYHLGRMAAYGALGAVAGVLGAGALKGSWQAFLSIFIGVMLVASAVGTQWTGVSHLFSRWLQRPRSWFIRLLKTRAIPAFIGLGFINGLLPCGLVYASAATVATHAESPALGSIQMFAFGLGTVPMMLALSLWGHAIPVSWRIRFASVTPWILGFTGLWLVARGIGIPGVCGTSGSPCCPR